MNVGSVDSARPGMKRDIQARTEPDADVLPPHWVRVSSRSKPGSVAFENKVLGIRTFLHPLEFEAKLPPQQRSKLASVGKLP